VPVPASASSDSVVGAATGDGAVGAAAPHAVAQMAIAAPPIGCVMVMV
jgi:hypothetical protein